MVGLYLLKIEISLSKLTISKLSLSKINLLVIFLYFPYCFNPVQTNASYLSFPIVIEQRIAEYMDEFNTVVPRYRHNCNRLILFQLLCVVAERPEAHAQHVCRLDLHATGALGVEGLLHCLERLQRLRQLDRLVYFPARLRLQADAFLQRRDRVGHPALVAPGNADALFNIGVIFLELNQIVTATDWFEKCIARAPRHAEAWVNLGIARERRDELESALTAYRTALDIDPRLPAAGNNLAHALARSQRHNEARLQYLATLQAAPDYTAAHEGLAASCLALGRVDEAVAHLRITLAAEPDNRGAIMALADALFESGKLDDAEPLAKRALALNPDAADAYVTLANLQGVRGYPELAVPLLETGYERTGNGGLLGMLAYQYRVQCDWDKWARAWQALAPRINSEAALGSPFWLLCEPITAHQQLTYTRGWAAQRFKDIQPMPASPAREHARVRVGYLSSDFQEHAAAYLIADVLEHHDTNRFEIFAYSHGPQDSSPMRKRVVAACEHFVDIAYDTDDAAAQRIRSDGIDILIDIKGYTVGDRITIMARRPCDIQVTWLGYPGTTGAPVVPG